MNKRAIAILGAIFLLIMGTLGFLIYSKYSGNKDNAAPTDNNTVVDTSTTTPEQNPGDSTTPPDNGNANAEGSVTKLTDDMVVSPVLFYDGSGITYFNNQGQLFQSSLDESGSQLTLTRKKMLDIPAKANISKILWPTRGDNFIAESMGPDGNKWWSYYNSQTGAYINLPPQVISVDWLPSSDRIVFVWLQDGKAIMEQGDPDAKNWTKIAEMWEPDDSLHVSPDGQSVLYYQEHNNNATNQIVQTTPDGKFWKGLVKEGYNYGVLWSPDSKRFLFGKRDLNTQKTQLWFYDLLTGEVRNIGLATTPDKAVWDKDSKTFYAAVPTTGVPGQNSLTVDTFYKVDTATSSQKEYKTGSTSVDGRDLFLNLDGNKLFFRNAQDGGLYYLDLNQQ